MFPREEKIAFIAAAVAICFAVVLFLGAWSNRMGQEERTVVAVQMLQDSLYQLTVAYNESQYDVYLLERHLDCYENVVASLLIHHVPPPDTVWADVYTPFGVRRMPKTVKWPDPCIRGRYFDVSTVEWLREGGK